MEASNSTDMDDSVAALLIEPRPPVSLQSSLNHSDQTSEELKQLLMRATMDLESTRSQAKLYENELHHFKTLLRSARHERDEAREEVLKLKETFFSSSLLSNAITAGLSSNPNNSGLDSHLGDAREYSLHIQHSSKASSSPGQHMQLDCISSSIMLDASRTHLSDLHWDLHDLPALRLVDPIHPDVQSNSLSPLFCGAKTGIVSMDMYQKSDHHMQQENAIFSEANELLEQEVQACYQEREESNRLVADNEFNIDEVLQPQTGSGQHWVPGVGVDQLPLMSQPHSAKDCIRISEPPSGVNDLYEILPCSDDAGGGAANISVAPWQAAHHGDLQISNISATTWGDTTSSNTKSYVAPKHLPEPPESDPEVMLRSLPETGKLLQAVMQAGPLLQTLLLAGPLPRWHRPPPTIPVDPMESSLMMQCCMGNNGINNMQKPWFSAMPISSPSSSSSVVQAGVDRSKMNETSSKGARVLGLTSMATATWTMAASATTGAWMGTVPTEAAKSMLMSAPAARATASAELSFMRAAEARTLMSTTEPLLSRSKPGVKSNAAPIMLNTSTNVSYSNRLLRSSALLPKRQALHQP